MKLPCEQRGMCCGEFLRAETSDSLRTIARLCMKLASMHETQGKRCKGIKKFRNARDEAFAELERCVSE